MTACATCGGSGVLLVFNAWSSGCSERPCPDCVCVCVCGHAPHQHFAVGGFCCTVCTCPKLRRLPTRQEAKL